MTKPLVSPLSGLFPPSRRIHHCFPGIPERGPWTPIRLEWLQAFALRVCLAMNEEPTTAVMQRCLDALQEGTAVEPLVRDLLERAVGRLRLLCAALLRRSYPRLTQPPLNLETD